MKYAIDAEFIDTPRCSALISLAVVAEDGRDCYFEFDFPQSRITPWLQKHVVPHLNGSVATFAEAASGITALVGEDRRPEFWCYFGAYDWYWFCRVFGGFMKLPSSWPTPLLYRDLAQYQLGGIGSETAHNALEDARATMRAIKKKHREIKPYTPEIFYRHQQTA